MTSYPEFLARKAIVSAPSGISQVPALSPKLKEPKAKGKQVTMFEMMGGK